MATAADLSIVEAEAPIDLSLSLYEVIDGRIVEKSMGAFELEIASALMIHLSDFLRGHPFGRALTEMIFLIDAERGLKLRPDVAFVSDGRWPIRRRAPRTEAWDVVPDLVVEVVSPTNKAGELVRKTLDYQRAGVRLVWHVYPVQEVVQVIDSSRRMRMLGRGDTLEGGDVIPGFSLPLASLFVDEEGESPA